MPERANQRMSMRIDLEVLSSFDFIITTSSSDVGEEESKSSHAKTSHSHYTTTYPLHCYLPGISSAGAAVCDPSSRVARVLFPGCSMVQGRCCWSVVEGRCLYTKLLGGTTGPLTRNPLAGITLPGRVAPGSVVDGLCGCSHEQMRIVLWGMRQGVWWQVLPRWCCDGAAMERGSVRATVEIRGVTEISGMRTAASAVQN